MKSISLLGIGWFSKNRHVLMRMNLSLPPNYQPSTQQKWWMYECRSTYRWPRPAWRKCPRPEEVAVHKLRKFTIRTLMNGVACWSMSKRWLYTPPRRSTRLIWHPTLMPSNWLHCGPKTHQIIIPIEVGQRIIKVNPGEMEDKSHRHLQYQHQILQRFLKNRKITRQLNHRHCQQRPLRITCKEN